MNDTRPENDREAAAFDAFEAAGWERAADRYDDVVGAAALRAAGPLLDAVAAGPGTHLLDVACGPGHVAALAAERGAAVTGVDVALAMVDRALTAHPGLDVRHADAQALPFGDGTFDAVVANLAILHIGRPERALAEAVRVLRPGGRTAWTVWDAPQRARLLGVLVDALAEAGATPPQHVPAGPPFFRFSVPEVFADLLRGAGLADVAVRRLTAAHDVASADSLWNGLIEGTVRTAALVTSQPATTLRAIRAAFERNLEPYRTDGGLRLPVSFVLAGGRRPLPSASAG